MRSACARAMRSTAYLSHMDFRIGSGLCGIHDGGNEAEDLHFYGGQYGIITRKPSPGWQFTLVDATFEGQAVAAIKEHEAGLTLIHPVFRNVPTAISIDRGLRRRTLGERRTDGEYQRTGADRQPREEPADRTQHGERGLRWRAVFASFRESGKKVAGPGETYEVKIFSHGLHFADLGRGRRDPDHLRDGSAAIAARGQSGSAGLAGARDLGQHTVAGSEGRRRDRRHGGDPQRRRRVIAVCTFRRESIASPTRSC